MESNIYQRKNRASPFEKTDQKGEYQGCKKPEGNFMHLPDAFANWSNLYICYTQIYGCKALSHTDMGRVIILIGIIAI